MTSRGILSHLHAAAMPNPSGRQRLSAHRNFRLSAAWFKSVSCEFARPGQRKLLRVCLSTCLLSALLAAPPLTFGASNASSTVRDPLAHARQTRGQVENAEAVIPVQCYTKTDGVSNPCWTCHTDRHSKNAMEDWELQVEYAFSDAGTTNHWLNLFEDRSEAIGAISDVEAIAYIRQDNYSSLRSALERRDDYAGWKPDLDLIGGVDESGFARDGSWWRAFRFKPFLGTFWPTNGSTDDIFVRLPPVFYSDRDGRPSVEIYKINLAILEAAIAVPDRVPLGEVRRTTEPLNEKLAGVDLDGDGRVHGVVQVIKGLPTRYVGQAAQVAVERFQYPTGTEFLHTVRYVDPDSPNLLSRRLKELRYSIKLDLLNDQALALAYTEEKDNKERGLLPRFVGRPDAGLLNSFGWQLQGFIEDADGALRLQTTEEHYYCMGCHSTLGVTVDQTFGFARKVPGAKGWGHQTLVGLKDVPQYGHSEPEILTYFRRVGGGDEFRENSEILERFFPGGQLAEDRVRRAATGGDRDIAWLLAPSRKRAIALNKAYMALVRSQTFDRGRDTVLAPARNVHKQITNGKTGFEEGKGVYRDGRLWLDWPASP